MPPLLPINLYSDNVAVAAPEIMAALARANAGPAQPYGQDTETHAMKIAFSDLFGTEVWVLPVSTGTAANAIALSANGTLNTEAIIVFRKQIAEELRYRLCRAGQVWSKMRYSPAQLNAYIEAGLWLRLAMQANAAAKRLSEGLSQVPGIRLIERVEMNLLFMQMPEKIIAGLEADGIGLGRRDEGVRMVTAWSTTTEEVDHVVHRATLHASKVR